MKGGTAATNSGGNYGCAGILLWLNNQSTCSILCPGTSSSFPSPPTTFFLDKTNLTSAITTQLFSCSCVIIGFPAKSIKRRVAQLSDLKLHYFILVCTQLAGKLRTLEFMWYLRECDCV
jgi:hypothetical protein